MKTDPNIDSGRQLTVAHIIPWMGMGGVEVATLRMAIATQHLVRNVAFCPPDAGELSQAFESAGIETVTYTPPEPSLRHVDRFYRESKQMAEKLRHASTDIIHFADMQAAYRNGYAALLSGRKSLCHIRSRVPKLGIRERLALLPVVNYAFVSRETRDSFALRGAAATAPVIHDAVQIPQPVPAAETCSVKPEFGIPEDCSLIGMIARVSPAKDFRTLALAARQVAAKHPNIRFLIVGDNDFVQANREHFIEVSRHIREVGVEQLFIFTGNRSDVPRLISAMDICVLCSHREGFPLSILEMMAMTKPVIATAVGGIPEAIDDKRTGYLHQHEDSAALASLIISLLENREMAQRIAAAGFDHVSSTFTTGRFVDELMAIYTRLTAPASSS